MDAPRSNLNAQERGIVGANIAVIGPEINIRISSKDPMKYIEKYKISARKLSQQYIDPTLVSTSLQDYPMWVARRSSTLANVANQFMTELMPQLD
jgi:hypothetical protein